MDDINSYFLNLAFNIHTTQAVAGLGGVLDAITNIQKNLQDVSTILSDKVVKSLATVQKQFDKIALSNEKIAKSTTKLSADFKIASKTITSTLQNYRDITEELEKHVESNELSADAIDRQTASCDEFTKGISQNVSIGQQIAAIWGNVSDATKKTTEEGGKHIGIGQQIAAVWSNISNTTKKTTEEGEKHTGIANSIAAAWTKVRNGVVDVVLNFASMMVGIQAIKQTFTSFVDEENKFNTANYRLYGTQKQILSLVNQTTSKFKLMGKDVMPAFVELAGTIRTTTDELVRMAFVNSSNIHQLGVSQKELANWQRSMKSSGWSLDERTIALNKTTEAMQKFGFSAQQVSGILGRQANSSIRYNMMWGSAKKAVHEFENTLQGMASFTNEPIAAVDQMGADITKALLSTEKVFYLTSRGMSKVTNSMAKEAIAAGGTAQLQLLQTKAGMSELVSEAVKDKKRMGGVLSTAQADIWADTIGVSTDTLDIWMRQTEMIDKYNATIKDASKNLNLFLSTDAELSKFFKAQDKEITKDMSAIEELNYHYGRATATISSAFDTMWSELTSARKEFMIAIAPAIVWLIKEVLTPIVNYVAKIIRYATAVIKVFTQTSDAIKELNKSAEPTVGWLNSFGSAISAIWARLSKAAKAVAVLAVGFGALFAVFIGSAVALGMWYAFMRITRVSALLSIAAAALAVGYSIYKIAEAMRMMATPDILYGVAALAIMLGMFGVAVFAMTALAPEIWLTIAALAALSIVAYIVSKAALGMSKAFDSVVDNVIRLTDKVSASELITIGGALVVFGAELTAAAIAIGIGGAAMAISAIALGLGMGGLSVAMFLLSDNAISKMKILGDGKLESFGRGLGVLASGVSDFTSAMGWCIEFPKGMKALNSGLLSLSQIDSVTISSIKSIISIFDNLQSSLSDIANAIYEGGYKMMLGSILFRSSIANIAATLNGLSAAAAMSDKLIPSIKGLTDNMSQLQSTDIIGAFSNLLLSIPTINSVTNQLSDAIQVGQEKIKHQIDELKASFVALQSMAERLDVPIGAAETTTKKKVVAETVSTIQVKTETSGGVSARWQQQEMQMRQIELMQIIADIIGAFGNDRNIGTIRGLLEEHLPKLGEQPSKLGTRMNNWS
jgi:predicted  nucleic acid-binding Zn-ribbon protein